MKLLTDKHRGIVAHVVDSVAALFVGVLGIVVVAVAYLCLAICWILSLAGIGFGKSRRLFARFYSALLRLFLHIIYYVYALLAAISESVFTVITRTSTLTLGKQYEPPNEDFHTDRISAALIDRLGRDYERGNTRRDAHPKHHGLLKARFEIEPGLDPKYAVGLFAAPPSSYVAWVRFSNSSPTVKPDSSADVRGIAIKLCDASDVSDEVPRAANHQDLLLVSERVFPTHTAGQFSYFTSALINPLSRYGLWIIYCFIAPWRWYVIRNTSKMLLPRHRSLLTLDYHSVTPYQFGAERAVKYVLRPSVVHKPSGTDKSTSFLRNDLRNRLAADDSKADDFKFDFFVHEQTDPYTMPVERPGIAWSEKKSVPQKVATLTLLKQRFDTEAQTHQCENITYTPWNSRPGHEPIGGINRAREAIYQRVASFRHERNELDRMVPTCKDLEKTWKIAQIKSDPS